MTTRRRRGWAAAALLAGIVALPGCGTGDELSAGEWVNESDRICSAGTDRAARLAPPVTPEEIVDDADTRIAILTDTRAGILAIGTPEGVDDAMVGAYLDELAADIEILRIVKTQARAGEPYVPLDVSAGLSATGIGLAGCVTFSDTIVRMTPVIE